MTSVLLNVGKSGQIFKWGYPCCKEPTDLQSKDSLFSRTYLLYFFTLLAEIRNNYNSKADTRLQTFNPSGLMMEMVCVTRKGSRNCKNQARLPGRCCPQTAPKKRQELREVQ